ncbi:MAG: hypothetical protein HYX69_21980 [Planctomycetia bacterium]|nr:hypothetical protein [Planctomycetia bacterium]
MLPENKTAPPKIAWGRNAIIARLPAQVFEKHLQKGELTTAAVVKVARYYIRSRRRNVGPDAGGNILTGDMGQLWTAVQDGSVDLMLTDPPYADLKLYARVAELAAAKLAAGGLVLAYCAHFHLPDVLQAMADAGLTYYWTFAVQYGNRNASCHSRRVQVAWKPIIAFSRGKPRQHEWITDLLTGSYNRKLWMR